MATLYITEQNAIVRKTGDRLIVEKDNTILLDVPCLKLEAVLIYGNVQVTTQALVEMLDHGIELAILSRSGKLRGQLTPPKAKNIPLRMRQYEVSQSESRCLAFARELVGTKIANCAAVLRRFRANHPEALRVEAVDELDRYAAGSSAATNLESLRGVEGAAAARYFGSLARTMPAAFGFAGRNRRPPRDPVNALLSLGYVLVGNEIQALLDAIGFDPSGLLSSVRLRPPFPGSRSCRGVSRAADRPFHLQPPQSGCPGRSGLQWQPVARHHAETASSQALLRRV